MAHLVETMAWTGATPWHGLGKQVSPDLTPDEMLVEAGLEWSVSKRPLYTTQHGEDGLQDAGEPTLRITSHYALVRDSDSSTLGVCGKNYVPSQNKDVFQFFDKFVKGGHMKMETAGALDHGRQVWGLANIQKGFTLPGGDEVRGYLLLANPHVWGESMRIFFTPIRVVCANTLNYALKDNAGRGFRLPHVKAFDEQVFQEAELALGLATSQLEKFEEQAQFLAARDYSDIDVQKYIATLFQPDAMPAVESANDVEPIRSFKRTALEVYNSLATQPGGREMSPGSWWSAFNAVTYVVDHKLGRERDAALTSAWFGPRSSLKQRALNTALEMAQAA
jgi:phage/plasmid-like protein (TIGR03299 family)